jgi:hypothetical protein
MNLNISADLATEMEERGIRNEDVEAVISGAESSGNKMYKPDTSDSLAKSRIGESWVFVEYTDKGDGNFDVHQAYCMKTEFAEEL